MPELSPERFRRLTAQLFNLLRRPRPHYELFEDRETAAPWFAMVLFPVEKEWDSYRLCRVLRKFLFDLGAMATRMGDPRFTRMTDGMISMVDTALTTEPQKGEEYDGRLTGL